MTDDTATDTPPEIAAVGAQVQRGVGPRRADAAQQRERIRSPKKRPPKPWAVCHKWGPNSKHTSRHWFSSESQAAAFIKKEKRRFGMHPHTGKEWGPASWWIEGPNVQIEPPRAAQED